MLKHKVLVSQSEKLLSLSEMRVLEDLRGLALLCTEGASRQSFSELCEIRHDLVFSRGCHFLILPLHG